MNRRDYLDSNGNLDLFQRRRKRPAQSDARAKRLQRLAVREEPLDAEGWADFAHEAQLLALAKRTHNMMHAAFVLRVMCLADEDRSRAVKEIESANERADAQLADLHGIPEAAEKFLRSDLWGHDDLRALAKRALDSLPEEAGD